MTGATTAKDQLQRFGAVVKLMMHTRGMIVRDVPTLALMYLKLSDSNDPTKPHPGPGNSMTKQRALQHAQLLEGWRDAIMSLCRPTGNPKINAVQEKWLTLMVKGDYKNDAKMHLGFAQIPGEHDAVGVAGLSMTSVFDPNEMEEDEMYRINFYRSALGVEKDTWNAWATDGRIGEIDLVCSRGGGYATLLIVYALWKLASGKRHGERRFKAVIVSLAYTGNRVPTNLDNRSLVPLGKTMKALGFQRLANVNYDPPSSSHESKILVAVADKPNGNSWLQQVARSPGMKWDATRMRICPLQSGSGRSYCV